MTVSAKRSDRGGFGKKPYYLILIVALSVTIALIFIAALTSENYGVAHLGVIISAGLLFFVAIEYSRKRSKGFLFS